MWLVGSRIDLTSSWDAMWLGWGWWLGLGLSTTDLVWWCLTVAAAAASSMSQGKTMPSGPIVCPSVCLQGGAPPWCWSPGGCPRTPTLWMVLPVCPRPGGPLGSCTAQSRCTGGVRIRLCQASHPGNWMISAMPASHASHSMDEASVLKM